MIVETQGPGYLRVTVQPGPDTNATDLEGWYNNEHGPLRLRLPFITSGDRYRATDGESPEWSAVYEISDLAWLEKRIYTRLREERSKRETQVMSTFTSLDRRIYSLVASTDNTIETAIQLTQSFTVANEAKETLVEWFNGAWGMGIPDPDIRRRVFELQVGGQANLLKAGYSEFLVVVETTDESRVAQCQKGLDRLSKDISSLASLQPDGSRLWNHHTTFDALREPPTSVITTDGAELRFQLDGNPIDPVVVCINSILTDFHVWDDVVSTLLQGINGKTYRVLRYNARGYSQQWSGSRDTTFDILADDLEYLLSRLNISKAHAIMGVSMGGVTALNFAIRYSDLLEKLIACDCNVASSPPNNQAWTDRIQLAKDKGMVELAKVTAKRWFTAPNHQSANFGKVLRMIEPANLDGFVQNAGALCDYDLKPKLSTISVPTMLVAGEGDGKLPQAMQGFDIPGASFRTVPEAGHLPMAEDPDGFVAVLKEFLT